MFQNIFIEVTRGQPTNPLAIYGSTLEEMSSSEPFIEFPAALL